MEALLKQGIELGLVGLGADRLARRWHRDHTLILAYHNIVPEGRSRVGDRSLHMPQAEFARQLDLLGDTHELVPLSSLNNSTDSRNSAGLPRAAITFDDAYRGALTAGVEELRERGVPATIFVAPGLLDHEAFWWDRLGDGSNAGNGSAREYALTELEGRQDAVLRWAKTEGLLRPRPAAAHARPADLTLIRSAAEEPEFTLASHSWSHMNLPTLRRDVLTEQLSRPIEWFRSRNLPYGRWIAYPYGGYSPRVRDVAGEIYSHGFTVDGGFVEGPPADRMNIARMNVPAGLCLRRFRLLTSGAISLVRESLRR